MSRNSEVLLCLEKSWQFNLGLIDIFKEADYQLNIIVVEPGKNTDLVRSRILNGSSPVIFMTPNPIIALGEYSFMKSLAATQLPVVFYNADPPDLTCHYVPDQFANLATMLGSASSERFWRNHVNQGPSAFSTYQPMTPAVEKKIAQLSNDRLPRHNDELNLFVPINYRWFGYSPEEFQPIFSSIPKFFRELIDSAVNNTLMRRIDSTAAFEEELSSQHFTLDKIRYRQLFRIFTYRLNLTKRERLFRILKDFPVLISSNIKPAFFESGKCKAKWVPTNLETSVDLFLNADCILTMPYIEDLIHDRVTTAFACGAVPFCEHQSIFDSADALWSKIPSFSWNGTSLSDGLEDIFSNPDRYILLGQELKMIAADRDMRFSAEKLLGLLQCVTDPYLSGHNLKSRQERNM